MNKYVYRLIIGILVYYFFRINQELDYKDVFVWNFESIMYLFYTIAVLQIIWEITSRAIAFWKSKVPLTSVRGLYILSVRASLLLLPLVGFFAYVFAFHLRIDCDCHTPFTPLTHFWMVWAQGFVIGLLVVAFEIIKHYITMAVREAKEKEIIQKELISAKFDRLKKQVNPHFLFNSFSVLSSLIQKDPSLAEKFVDKLSDMYRYILEHEDQALVKLQCELTFLEDYIFLMQIRYPDSLKIKESIELDKDLTRVPSMSLQLLVENAIKHNSFSKEQPLEITIQNEGEHFILVENRKSEKTEIIPSTGIGLSNLSKRLMLSMKEGLQIIDEKERFRVKLPVSLQP